MSDLNETRVDKQFRELEESLTDPYQSIAKFSHNQREKFDANNYNNPGLDKISSPGRSLIDYGSLVLDKSKSTVNERNASKAINQGSRLLNYTDSTPGSINYNKEITTGLVNRPGVDFYNHLFSDNFGDLSVTFFQFQNQSVTSSLLDRTKNTNINTQGLIPSTTGVANKLLIGNEVTYGLNKINEQNNQSNQSNQSNFVVNRTFKEDGGSFHPKVGYNDRYAFIGTQNITQALNGYNTQESILVLNRRPQEEIEKGFNELVSLGANSNPYAYRDNKQFSIFAEGYLANQLVVAQDTITSQIQLAGNYSNFDSNIYNQSLNHALQQSTGLGSPQFVFSNGESRDIFNRLSNTIETASYSKTDQVVISGKELNLIFGKSDDTQVNNFKEKVLKLAQEGRLTIISDGSYYLNNLFRLRDNNEQSNSLDRLGSEILENLIKYNKVKSVSLGMNHEKSTMVFGGSAEDLGQLKFFATGSANYTVGAMINPNKNTELSIAIGVDEYRKDSNSVVEQTLGLSILNKLNQESSGKNIIYERYQTLSGVNINQTTGVDLYYGGRGVEKTANREGILALKDSLLELQNRLGENIVELKDRYNTSGKLVGLSLIVKPLDNLTKSNVVINMTVNRENNVILSDLNKVIAGSVFINSSTSKKVVAGQTVEAGQSLKMDSILTATGFIGTVAREISTQSRYQLIDKHFFDSYNKGDITLDTIGLKYLSMLNEDIKYTERGEGKLNIHSLVDQLREQNPDPNNLKEDIKRLSLKIATGELSLLKEFNPTQSQIRKRYTVIYGFLSSLVSNDEALKSIMGSQFLSATHNDPDRIFADVRALSVLSSEESFREYSRGFRSLNTSLVSSIASPFLALHEQTYSAYQAKARTPVYSEGDNIFDENSTLGKLVNEGFLNPAAVAHSTKIGQPGQFYRAINHTASGSTLMLPGYGSLNQVKVVDSFLHEGATAIYDYKILFSSLNNFTYITQESHRAELSRILERELTQEEFNSINANVFSNSKFLYAYSLPENKLEQLQQRIKNITGARADLDLNQEILNKIKSVNKVDISSYKQNENILVGRIKSALPMAQSKEVVNFIESFTNLENRPPSYEEVVNYFRELERDRSLTQRGIIGTSPKRIALSVGFSNLGDYMYGNAGYNEPTGYIRNISTKINIDNINNIEDTQRKLTEAFKEGNVIYNEPITVNSVENPGLKDILNELKSLHEYIKHKENYVNQLRETLINTREGILSEQTEAYNFAISNKESIQRILDSNKAYSDLYTKRKSLNSILYNIKEKFNLHTVDYNDIFSLNNSFETNVGNLHSFYTKTQQLDFKYLYLKGYVGFLHEQYYSYIASNKDYESKVLELKQVKEFKRNLSLTTKDRNLQEYIKTKESLSQVYTAIEDLRKSDTNLDFALDLKAQRYAQKDKFIAEQNNDVINKLEENNRQIYELNAQLNKLRAVYPEVDKVLSELDNLKQVKYNYLTENTGKEPKNNLDKYLELSEQIYNIKTDLQPHIESEIYKKFELKRSLQTENWDLREKKEGNLKEYFELKDRITEIKETLEKLKENPVAAQIITIQQTINEKQFRKHELIATNNQYIQSFISQKDLISKLIQDKKKALEEPEVLQAFELNNELVKALQEKSDFEESNSILESYKELRENIFEGSQNLEKFLQGELSSFGSEELRQSILRQRELNKIKKDLADEAKTLFNNEENLLDKYISLKENKFKLKNQINSFLNEDRFSEVKKLHESIKSAPNLIKQEYEKLEEFKETQLELVTKIEALESNRGRIKELEKNNSLIEEYESLKRIKSSNLNTYNLKSQALLQQNQPSLALEIVTLRETITKQEQDKYNLLKQSRREKQGKESVLDKYDSLARRIYEANKSLNPPATIKELGKELSKLKEDSSVKVYSTLKSDIKKNYSKLDSLITKADIDKDVEAQEITKLIYDIKENRENLNNKLQELNKNKSNPLVQEYLTLLDTQKSLQLEVDNNELSKDIYKIKNRIKELKISVTQNKQKLRDLASQIDSEQGTNLLNLMDELDSTNQELIKLKELDPNNLITRYDSTQIELKQLNQSINSLLVLETNRSIKEYYDNKVKEREFKNQNRVLVDTWLSLKQKVSELSNQKAELLKIPKISQFFSLVERIKEEKNNLRNIAEQNNQTGDAIWLEYNNIINDLHNKETGLFVQLENFRKDESNKVVFDTLETLSKLKKEYRTYLNENKDTGLLKQYLDNQTKINELKEELENVKGQDKDILDKLNNLSELKKQRRELETDSLVQGHLTNLNNIRLKEEELTKYREDEKYRELFNLLDRKKELKDNEKDLTSQLNPDLLKTYEGLYQNINEANKLLAEAPSYSTYLNLVNQKKGLQEKLDSLKNQAQGDLLQYIQAEDKIKTLNVELQAFGEIHQKAESIKALRYETERLLSVLSESSESNSNLSQVIYLSTRLDNIKALIKEQFSDVDEEVRNLEEQVKNTLYSRDFRGQLIQNNLYTNETFIRETHILNVLKADLESKLKLNNLLIVTEGDKDIFKLDKGLYMFDESGKPIQLGRIETEGLLTLNRVNIVDKEGRHSSVSVKIGSSKDKGYSVFIDTPNVYSTSKGVLNVDTQEFVIKNPSSGIRLVGVKGPVLYMEESLFTSLDKHIQHKNDTLTPKSIKEKKIYTLNTFSQFKDFSYQSGFEILLDPESRAKVTADSHRLAETLAILFLDTDTKQLLSKRLQSTGRSQVASALKLIKGLDVSTLEGSNGKLKPKYNLGVIASGLTYLADPSSEDYSSNVLLGDLSGVKRLVQLALTEGEEGDKARELLQQRAEQLIDKVINESGISTDVKRKKDTLIAFNDSSSLGKGAGILAHTVYIASQLLIDPLTKEGSNLKSGLYELKVDDISKYLTNKVHREKVNFIASTSGLPILGKDHFRNKEEYEGYLSNRLQFLQYQLNSAVIIEDIKDITTSSSLVASGINNETAFEYQNLAGTSMSYLNRYRRLTKQRKVGTLLNSKESQTIRRAYSILLTSTLGSEDSEFPTLLSANREEVLHYQLLLKKPVTEASKQGWYDSISHDSHNLIVNYTPIANKLGLLEEVITNGDTNSYNLYKEVSKINTLAVGANNDPAVENRAATISLTTDKFYYMGDKEVGIAQANEMKLSDRYLQMGFGSQQTALDNTTQILEAHYVNYLKEIQKVESSDTPDVMLDSFSEYLQKQISGDGKVYESEMLNQQLVNLAKRLESKSGLIKGVYKSENRQLNRSIIRAEILKENERQIKLVEESLYIDKVNRSKQYIDAMLTIYNTVQTKLNENVENTAETQRLKQHLNEVANTKVLVLPAYTVKATDSGEYSLSFKSTETMAPHQGVLLGTDVLSKIPLVFPSHVEDLLINQIELRKKVSLLDPILEKVRQANENQDGNILLNAQEVQTLREVTDLMYQSIEGTKNIASTSFTQKAYNEGEVFYGSNVIPVNSLNLDAQEAVVGGKLTHLNENYPVRELLSTYYDSLRNYIDKEKTSNISYSAEKIQDLNSIVRIVTNLGGTGIDLDTRYENENSIAAEFEQIVNLTKQGVITEDHINRLETAIDERILGSNLENYQTREVAVRRGGAPAGIAGSIGDNFFHKTLTVDEYNRRLQEQGSELNVSKSRSYTATILPTVSHLMSQQGDFDGDTFQVLMGNSGENAKKLLTLKQQQIDLFNKIENIKSKITRRSELEQTVDVVERTNLLTNRVTELETKLNKLKEEEQAEVNLITRIHTAKESIKKAELEQVKRWVAFNQSIPLDIVNGLSSGEVVSFSNFARTTIGSIEDSSSYTAKVYDKYERQLNIVKKIQTIFPGFQVNNLDKQDKTQLLSVLTSNQVVADIDDLNDLSSALSRVTSNEDTEINNKLLEYHASQASLGQALDNYSKHLTKAAGSLLTPEQVDLMQSLIGQAGTDLIGKSYNTLIPLLDQAMSDQGLNDVLLHSMKDDNFKQQFEGSLFNIAEKLNIEPETVNSLLNKLNSSEEREKVRTRYEATYAFLGSMQQVIRDALKDKSGRGLKSQLVSILSTEYEPDKLVGDLLKGDSEGNLSYEDINKMRNVIFKEFIGSALGSDLRTYLPESTPQVLKESVLSSKQIVDPGITGFGALLMLRELSLIDKESDYENKIINSNDQLKSLFQQELKEGRTSSALEFSTKYVLDLLQRTQASFADQMLGDTQRETKLKGVIKLGLNITEDDIEKAKEQNQHKAKGLELMKAYAEFTQTDDYKNLSSKDKDTLGKQVSQEISLHTIRERGGITVEDLYRLQVAAKETNALKTLETKSVNTSNDEITIMSEDALLGVNLKDSSTEASYTAIHRALRRGQLTANQVQSVLSNKLENIGLTLPELENSGLNLSHSQQEQIALMLGFNTRGDLTPEEQKLLAYGVGSVKESLQYNSENIQALYASSEQYDDIVKAMHLSQTQEDWEALDNRRQYYQNQLLSYLNNNPQDKLQRLQDDDSYKINVLESSLNDIVDELNINSKINETLIDGGNNSSKHIALKHDPKLASLGALAVPLLLATFKDGVDITERVGMLGYDIIQSVSHLGTKEDRLITKLGEYTSEEIQERNTKIAQGFQVNRLYEAMKAEGAILGGLKGAAGELLFSSISDIAYKGIDKLLAKTGHDNLRVGRGIGVVAAEVLTTVAAMSFSRAITRQKTQDDEYIPDFVGRILQDFTEQVWLAAEQAQQDIFKPEYEVIDTDENEQLDVTTTAELSRAELDSITGYVTIDENSNGLLDEGSVEYS